MLKRVTFFFIILIIITKTNFLYSSEDTTNDSKNKIDKNSIGVRFVTDAYINPYFYEHKFKGNNLSLGALLEIGITYKFMSFTLSVMEKYNTYNGQNEKKKFVGGENKLGGSFNFYFNPVYFLDVKTGTGVIWYSSLYNYKDLGRISISSPGIFITLDLLFKIPKVSFYQIRVTNSFDLVIVDERNLFPNYLLTIRNEFKPNVDWLSLHIETGLKTFYYKNNNVTVNTASFIWGIGVSVDLKTRDLKSSKNATVKEDEQFDDKTIDGAIKKMKTAKEGDIIVFRDIIFQANSDSIMIESYDILDAIFEVLLSRESLIVEISGYTNDTGRPENELILSVQRALKVSKYLINKGISAKRIKASGAGALILKQDKVDESNRRVEFKILKG